jgi:hypothetical protein
MKRAIWCLNNLYSSSDFTDFAYLGDLRNYRLSDLRAKLQQNWNEEIQTHTSYQLVTWSNSDSLYTVCYTLQGEFVQIVKEVWKKDK